MRHRVKKIKIKKGQDATQSVLRKLIFNFIEKNRLQTTLKRAKIVRSLLERLINRAKSSSEASKNIIKKYLPQKKSREKLTKIAQEYFKDRVSGFVKVIKIGFRLNDGSQMARVEWVKPVVVEDEKKKIDIIKSEAKKGKISQKTERKVKNQNQK